MKIIFKLIITLGFVLMIGAAGGTDVSNISFSAVVALELCGMFTALLGYSALCHYKRYLRRRIRSKKMSINIKAAEKELSLT